jgi:hypothetical protein
MGLTALMGAAMLVVATADAEAVTATFRINGVELEMPVPEGYCLPRGRDVDVAQAVSAADADNVTHLTLYPCQPQEPLTDYILVKTPRQAVLQTIDREQLLAGLSEVFDNVDVNSMMGSMNDRIEENLASVIGTRPDLVGRFRPLARDESCAYLGGTMQVTAAQLTYSISVGACMTAISGRMLTVYLYGPDRGSAGVAELLVRAKALAASISARPAL